jgi:tetratricopeptide (TPR) repeat protein
MRHLVLGLILLSSLTVVYSQEVEVKATTDKKEVETILKKGRKDSEINRAFFDEHDKCRSFIRTSEWAKAESSCRLAVSRVEKLPKEHTNERSWVRVSLATALLGLHKTDEAILLFNESLEISKATRNDSAVETGEVYFLMAQAYHVKRDVAKAAEFYGKAEATVRAAFVEMGSDEGGLRLRYPRLIQNILDAHIVLLEDNELHERAEVMRRRKTDFEKEFAKYL